MEMSKLLKVYQMQGVLVISHGEWASVADDEMSLIVKVREFQAANFHDSFRHIVSVSYQTK